MTPLEVQSMARMTVEFLRIGRKRGEITPDHPITGPEIVSRYNLKFQAEVREKDFCAVVNYARDVMEAEICSSTKGYWWGTEPEYVEFYARETERWKTQKRAAIRPMLKFRRQAQTTILEEAIKQEFNAEKITA